MEENLTSNNSHLRKRAYEILKIMLLDRGYSVEETGFSPLTEPQTVVCVYIATNAHDKIYVFMAPEEKQLGKTYVQEILELVSDVKKHIIIATSLGLTSYVAKEVISIENCKIELFKYSELQAAIGRHVLVPTYIVIPEQHVLNLLIRLHCEKKEDLPRMLDTDPVARYFNFESGTVLKLIHHIPDWPGLEYYRVVI